MKDRRNYLGGSDAIRLVKGDWFTLYMEKKGEIEPEDLSGNFQVQLGIASEELHRRWVNLYHHQVSPRSLTFHPHIKWMAANIDGWIDLELTFLELKHTHGRASARDVADTYLPQIAHYCNVFGVSSGYLSFIAGNAAPQVINVKPPVDYLGELIEIEQAFWWCIENDSPPDAMPGAAIMALKESGKAMLIDGLKYMDMSTSNEWAVLAADYIATLPAAEKNEEAKAALKAMVPADVGEAVGHGIRIKRDKRGSLRFTMKED